MLKTIFSITLIAFLSSCGSDTLSYNQRNDVPLDSLTGLNWYQRVLETEYLSEINIKGPIPEKFTRYLTSIDRNFRMASDGEPWKVGCTPVMIMDSTKITKTIDKKTGDTMLTTGFVEVDAPSRKLVYFGQNQKMAALIYFSGGFGKMQHLILFKMDKGKIIEHWHGTTKGDISTEKELLMKLKNQELEAITAYI